MRCYNPKLLREEYVVSTCLVSIIDIEGNSRFPRSIQREGILINSDPAFFRESDPMIVNYLERSYILEKSEELLSRDVLTLKCDFYSYLDLDAIVSRLANLSFGSFDRNLHLFKESTYAFCRIEKDRTVDPNGNSLKSDWDPNCRVHDFTVHDFTTALSLPENHEFKKRFGINEVKPLFGMKLREDIEDILEHIWWFDVHDDPSRRYLLSMDEREDSLGCRLLKSSTVIRRMVNSDMKERREKCIELVNVTEKTFVKILNFLARGELQVDLTWDEVLDVYKFSHFYEMNDLQRVCAETMVKLSEFDELERVIDLYSDEHLSRLLELRRLDKTDVEEPQLKKDEIPYSDCYV